MLFGRISMFGLGFFVLKSLLGIVRQWSHEKCAILSVKPPSHVRILIYKERGLLVLDASFQGNSSFESYVNIGIGTKRASYDGNIKGK